MKYYLTSNLQRTCFALVLFFFLIDFTSGSNVGKWKSYTSKKEVRDVIVLDGVVWAATSGGAFSYNLSNQTFEQFTTSEGLRTIDLTAITVDGQGNIWLGASNGFVHSYNPVRGEWNYVTGIASMVDEPAKRINAFRVSGDTIFILSEIGVSVFSVSKREFGDSYRRFGTSPQLNGKATSLEIFNNNLWIGTNFGIASTPVTNPNPSEPDSWQVVNTGLPSTLINDLILYHDTLFAATGSGLTYFDGTSWKVFSETAGRNIIALSKEFHIGTSAFTPSLYFITSNELWMYDGSSFGVVFPFTFNASSLTSEGILGSIGNGVMMFFEVSPSPPTPTWINIVPPGPPVNKFVGMTVDERGVFWSGTGTASSDGFLSFDGNTWNSFTPQSLPQLGIAHSAYQIDIGTDNSKWISTFGEGVVQLNADNSVAHVFNTTNGLPYTENTSNTQDFCVVTGVVTDRNGVAWINVRSAVNRNLLAIYSPRTDSFRYANYPTGTKLPILTNIIQDNYGTKWFTSLSIPGNNSPGLVFFDETKKLSRRIDAGTGWGIITKDQDGLTDNEITAVAVDNDGSLWVGTNQGGINIIVDPTVPYRILPYRPLNGKRINDILVDPLNQKWVATEQGVFLFSPDGTTIIERFTEESTQGKLPDDQVASLTIDRNNGTLYFATETGLATLTTASVFPLPSFNSLKIFPNPFLLPSSSALTVDGLVEGSMIKILSVSGNLVKEISTPGGRVGFWDGTDEEGKFVASGVYIVTAFSKDGSAVGKGKVAVVRK
ncbi:MAG: hypothetical protein HYZ33_03255 [Ignavibacteriales bacterium]|nr:hypothetical protein [Ignavibacteriales bacterium]